MACASESSPSKPPVSSPRLITPKVASPQPSATNQSEQFQEAIDSVMSTVIITQSAYSQADWNLVVNRWQTAITLLKTVQTLIQNC